VANQKNQKFEPAQPECGKLPWLGFWCNFGVFQKFGLSRLNPDFRKKDRVEPAEAEFLEKITMGVRRQGALALQLDFCTVLCLWGFYGACRPSFPGPCFVLDPAPFHPDKHFFLKNRRINAFINSSIRRAGC